MSAQREPSTLERWYPPVPQGEIRTVALPPMQCNILSSLCEGKSNAMIAEEWGIAEDTVKTHLKRAFGVLGARDRVHAVTLVLTEMVVVRRKPQTLRWPTVGRHPAQPATLTPRPPYPPAS